MKKITLLFLLTLCSAAIFSQTDGNQLTKTDAVLVPVEADSLKAGNGPAFTALL